MSNVFQKIGHFFSAVIHFVISPAGRDKIAKALDEAQKLLAPALDAASAIAALTPSRSDDEIMALANRYALGTVTPDMLRNDAVVSAFLKRAAMAELRHVTKTDLPDSVLDLAVQSAYLVYKQAKADMAEPVPAQPGENVYPLPDPTAGAPIPDASGPAPEPLQQPGS